MPAAAAGRNCEGGVTNVACSVKIQVLNRDVAAPSYNMALQSSICCFQLLQSCSIHALLMW